MKINAGVAMNTIPSTFNARQINRTVLGGTEKLDKVTMPVTCIVFSRSGNQYRSRILSNLLECGFEHIICVEEQIGVCNTDQISRQFPQVQFIIALEKVTPGDLLNMGMSETTSPYVLVLQDDLCMEEIPFNSSIAKKLASLRSYCIVPRLITSIQQPLPANFIPSSSKSVFNVNSTMSIANGSATLYPYDMVGFYDREKYIRLGGADYTIETPYWQNLDLSFRAWLWGEKISIASSFQFYYSGDVPSEDQTANLSYLRFYLKNLLPVFKTDHAEIPKSSFFAFKSRSSCGFSETLKQFNDARKWTNENKYRFKLDAASLIENWGKIK